MTLESLGVLIAFITGLGAVIVSIYTSINSVSQKELKAIHAENDRLRSRIETLEGKLAERESRIELLEGKLNERDDRIDTLEHQAENMQMQIRELQQENVILREEVELHRKSKSEDKP